MMDFQYTEDISRYEPLFSQSLKSLRCKHVMMLTSDKAKELYDCSRQFGYPQVMWGYGSGLYKNESTNRLVQLHTIRRMIYKQVIRPFRLVIDEGGVLWVDNLHSCIRDILVFGDDVCLKDTAFYIIDLGHSIPIIVNRNHCVHPNLTEISGAIVSAQKRNQRTNPKIRRVFYTIEEFMTDNQITLDAIGLDPSVYEAYKRTCTHRKGVEY